MHRLVLLIFLSQLAVSCVRVKPYQKGNLAKRHMVSERDSGEARFEQHARGAREGADGGTGSAGGGCGCN